MPGAPDSPNFAFLAAHDRALLDHAVRAERYVFDDPNSALVKLRHLAELFARGVAAHLGLPLDREASFSDVERRLRDAGQLDRQLHQVMRSVRLTGNPAAHSLDGDRRDALHCLKLTRQLAIWFHKAVKRDPSFRAGPFVPPPDPSDADDELRQQLDELRQSLVEKQTALDEVQGQIPELEGRVAQAVRETVAVAARQAATDIELDESDTRSLIDQQLRDAGWEADSEELRHGRGTRPVKGRNLAIAEWPTSTGPADYVLFVGLRA